MHLKKIFVFIFLLFSLDCFAKTQTEYSLNVNNQTGVMLKILASGPGPYLGPTNFPQGNTLIKITPQDDYISFFIGNDHDGISDWNCYFSTNKQSGNFDLNSCQSFRAGFLIAKMSDDHKSVRLTVLPNNKGG